ncbi:MAG: hypothetical protein ACRDVN_03190 [Jiangellaceae bacterium]
MIVTVWPPRVRGAEVRFGWDQQVPNRLQHRNRWSIGYPGVPLRHAAPELLLEIMLSLQLPVWAAMGDQVEVRLPQPLPEVVVRWWLAYHDIGNVTVGPSTYRTGYRPWTAGPAEMPAPRPVAVTFGAGKDSTLAYEAMAETYGRDQVLLLHAVHSFSMRRRAKRLAAKRSRTLLLAPPRSRGADVQLMVTDFMANLAPAKLARPGVNLYLAGGLPALLHRGCEIVTVSYTAAGYWVRDAPGKARRWGNRRNRPEALAALGDYYARVLGHDVRPCTTHYAISEFVSFKTLLRRYPEAFDGIVMCMRADTDTARWCHDCKKCFEYAVFGLSLGRADPTFDYDALLGRSSYVRSLVAHVEGSRSDANVRARWASVVGTRTHFAAFCHALHLTDPTPLQGSLGVTAVRNLAVLRAGFGTVPFPAVDVIHRAAVEASGPPAAHAVARLAARCTEVVDDLPGVLLLGNSVAEFAHGERAPFADVGDLLAVGDSAGHDG